MIIRDLNPKDTEALKLLHKQGFPFPDLTNSLFMSKKGICDDAGVLQGAGLVRLTSEAVLILNEDLPQTTRTKMVLSVADSLLKDVRAQGMDECHAFVRSANIEDLLRRMGFQESKGGTVLVLHF